MMKGIALSSIISIFSVVIPIQSIDIAYTYNYDNFGKLCHQGDREDFNIYRYEDINKIFDTEYKGTSIGGAFSVQGDSVSYAPGFEGYVLDITATFYCGSTHEEEGWKSLCIVVYYNAGKDSYADLKYICEERGWHYNYTWIPPSRFDYDKNFHVEIRADNATINKAYGFDDLRITTTDKPPQLLLRDNNLSNNDP